MKEAIVTRTALTEPTIPPRTAASVMAGKMKI